MFDELPSFGLVFVLVFLLVFVVDGGCTVCVRAVLVLERLFVVEVRRGDESDDLFERVFWVFPDEEVYESGYAAEKALKVADDQSRSKFSGRGAVIGFEGNGYCWNVGLRVSGMIGCGRGHTAFLSYCPKL